MSDDNKKSEGSSTAKDEGQKADVSEVQKRYEELLESNKRLLEESKSHKTKASEYKSRLEAKEKEEIEKSGDLAKLLEHERKEKEKIADEAKKLKSTTLDQKVREFVSKHGKDVHDIDDLLNQPKHRGILLAGIDKENLTVDENAVKNYVNAVLSEKPWLKKHLAQEGVDATKPGGSGAQKNLSSLSDKELDAIIGL